MVKKLFEDEIEGTAYYLSPRKRSVYKGVEGKYQFTLEISKEDAKRLKDAGAVIGRDRKVGTDDDGNPIEIDYSVKPKSDFPIPIYDAAADSLDDAIKSGLKIGNGSKVAVDLFVYHNDLNNGVGVNGVQIIELKEYVGGGGTPENRFKPRGAGIANQYQADNEATDTIGDDEIPF